MASPAAVLSILVQARGIAATNTQLKGLHTGLGSSSRAASKMGDDLDRSSRKGSKALGALKSGAGLAAGALGVVGLAGAVKSAVGEFEEARKVGANTNQVIKSTGGVANVSAKHVAGLSSAISKKAGIDDEAIQSGANLLLTFKNIRNETGKGKDIFDQATAAAVDLSAAGFGSLSSTSKQLGKALNDPVKGMTALGRSGVTFSEDQKKAIEALLKTGKAADRVKAQQIILKEVQSQVGGQAAAQATTMDKLKVTLSNLAEAAGSVLVPALDKIGKFLVVVINQMIEGKGAGGAIVSVFKNVGGAIGKVAGIIKGAVNWFKEHQDVSYSLGAAVGVVAAALIAMRVAALLPMIPVLVTQASLWVAVGVAMIAANAPIILIIAGIAALAAGLVYAYRHSEAFRNIIDKVWAVIKTVATAAWDFAKVALPALVGGIVSAATAVFDFVTHLSEIPGKIVNAGKAIVNGIVDGIKALPGLLTDAASWLWDMLKKGLEAYLDAYKAAGSWVLDRIVDGFKAITSLLASVGKWLLDRVVSFVKAEIAGVKKIGEWFLNRIVDGFKVITGLLASVGGWLKNRIVDFIKLEVAGIKAVGSWLLNRIVDGFKVVTNLLSSVGGWIKNRVVEFIKLEVAGLTEVGSWIVNRVVDGFKTVTKALEGVGGWLKNRLVEIFDAVKNDFIGIGGSLIGWIVDGLKGGMKALGRFAISVLKVIDLIPGVSTKGAQTDVAKFVGLAQGGTVSKDGVQALAEGGIVRKPIVMMGEEAPRHPEYVIPTNPAYRDRAKMLLGQAAGAIGFARGGQYDRDYGQGSSTTIPFEAAAKLAEAAGLPGITYAQIAIGESALKPGAVSNDGGFGLWQMTPRVQSAAMVAKWNSIGSYFNPWNNAQMAKVLAGSSTGVSNYYGTSSVTDWNKHYTGDVAGYDPGGGGVLGSILGAAGDVVSALNPMDFIKKLPGLGDLPDWLKGTGKYILDNVKDWIKDKVSSILPDVGGGTPGKTVGSVGKAIALAVKMGFPQPSTSQLTGGTHAAGSLHYSGQAVDFGDAGRSAGQMQALHQALWKEFGTTINELFYDPMSWYVDAHKVIQGQFGGHGDHIHVGFAQGGVYGGNGAPFVGSFQHGGRVPADGYGYLHAGETVTPRGSGNGPMVHVEHMEIRNEMDLERFSRSLGWQLKTGGA